MKILALWISFISLSGWAVTDTQVSMNADNAYMQFFLKDYLKWHQSRFGSDFFGLKVPGGKAFIKKAVSLIDHWKVPGSAGMDQILIGESFKGDQKFYNYRLYLHPPLQNEPFLKKRFSQDTPDFLEWDDAGKVCFLFKVNSTQISWINISKEENAYYLEHRCEMDGAIKTTSYSLISNEITQWKNPFPIISFEFRTYSQAGIESIFYNQRFTHMGKIPSRHYYCINSHGEKILLPFDKYSVDGEGSLTIYYP